MGLREVLGIDRGKYAHLRERLAELEHERWSRWMQYLFTRCTEFGDGYIMEQDDVARWKRLAATAYKDLTEGAKNSDRGEADRTIALLAELSGNLLGSLTCSTECTRAKGAEDARGN